MWSSAWLLAGEVPGGAWGRLLALSRSAQVDREVPALGKDFAATSAQHLIIAESLAMEAAWDCFLEVRMWLTLVRVLFFITYRYHMLRSLIILSKYWGTNFLFCALLESILSTSSLIIVKCALYL